MRHRPQKRKVCSIQNPGSAHPSSGRGSQGVAGPLASRRRWGVRNEGLRGAVPHPWSGQQLEAVLGHLRETVLGDGGLPPPGREGVQALTAAGRRAGGQERGQADMLCSVGAAGGEQGPLWCRWGQDVGVPHCAAQATRAADLWMTASLGSPGDNLPPHLSVWGTPWQTVTAAGTEP